MWCLILSLLISSVSTAHEWLYPVALLDDGTILLIHQKEPTHIELFSWDPYTKKATKAAPSCTSSKNHSSRVTVVSGIDYRYASCTDTALFYITRQVDDRAVPAARCQKHAHCRCRPLDPVDAFLYSINSIPLSELEVVGHETLQEAVRRSSVRETPLIAPQERPLVFLKMISDKEGFVLEHAQMIEKDADIITLHCHHLHKDPNDTPDFWSLSYLFSYTIPAYLVFPHSSDRLYEGFLPFIPWYDSTAVYFVDYKGSDAGIYGYSLKTHEVIPVVKPVHNSLYCAPILIGKNLIYGDNSPRMVYQDGQLLIEMPTISIKSNSN